MKKTLIFIFLTSALRVFAQTNLPIMEGLFGASATNAAIGNKKLTVGISKYGELVSLRWPCANFFDHLNYRTLYPVPWGWQAERYNRFYNANERQGSFAGLKFSLDDKNYTTWFRDEDWTCEQTYFSENTPIVVTKYKHPKWSIEVVCTDWVDAESDVLHRQFVIKKTGYSPLKNVEFIHVANLALCNQTPAHNPGADWTNDLLNGFATVWDTERDAFLSFIPSYADKSKLPSAKATNRDIQDFIKKIETIYPIASTTSDIDSKSVFSLIGADKKATNTYLDEENAWKIKLPNFDKKEGIACAKNAAFTASFYALNLTANKTDSIHIFFSFANNLTQTHKIFQAAKSKNSLQQCTQYWDVQMQKATLPQTGDAVMQRTLKRNLINILLATNGDAGCISSSVGANQPPYTMVWPRDAAVMAYVLDCAGFTEEAEKTPCFLPASNANMTEMRVINLKIKSVTKARGFSVITPMVFRVGCMILR
jgi:GH15 family glucan-1,4-alpha-glucosidase